MLGEHNRPADETMTMTTDWNPYLNSQAFSLRSFESNDSTAMMRQPELSQRASELTLKEEEEEQQQKEKKTNLKEVRSICLCVAV